MAEYPHYPAQVALLKEQAGKLTARVAELENANEALRTALEVNEALREAEYGCGLGIQAANAVLRMALEEMGAVLKCRVIHQGYHAMSCLEKSDWIVSGKVNCTKEYFTHYASGEGLCAICKIAKIRRAALSSAHVAAEVERQQDDPIRKALERIVAANAELIESQDAWGRQFEEEGITVGDPPCIRRELAQKEFYVALAAAREALKGAKP